MKFLLLLAFAVSLAPALHAQAPAPAIPKRGIIMVRVADDGALSDENFKPLADDEALKAYIKARKEALEADGKEPQLSLRGEKKVLYEHGRDVIRVSFAGGVKRAIYSSIIRPHMTPAGEKLPKADKYTFIIAITADGRVSMNGEGMDSGPDDRAITRMVEKLKLAATLHEDGAMGLTVWVLADNHAKHPRVIDVLNALSEAKIRKIHFAGGEE